MGCIFSSSSNESEKPGDNQETYIQSTYTFGKTLGKGGSCRVVRVTEKATEEQYALKIISKEAKMKRDLFEKENKILRVLDHPNILKLIECHEDSKNFYIVTELLEGGELFDRIVDEKYPITEKTASMYARTMLEAIKHCHDMNIIHRDIKPENLVFKSSDPNSPMVLIDFGCAKEVERKTEYKDIVGTPYYLAPESAAGNRYKRTGEILMSSDLWAIGVISYVLLTGRPPFNGHTNSEIFKNIIKKSLRFPAKVKLSKDFQDFCKAILKKSPKHRLKLEDALNDPWVMGENTSGEAISKDVIKVLRQFNKQSKLKKAITKVLAQNMGEKPTKKIEEHFNNLDKDKSGALDKDELCFLLMDMGVTEAKAKEEAAAMIEQSDTNKSGSIEFEEFATIWQRKMLSLNEKYIHTVFGVLDTNADGQIDPKELAQVLDMTNEGEVNEIIKEVDINEDGKINFEEFREAMLERNVFDGKGADVGMQLKEDEIHEHEEDYSDIDKEEEEDKEDE